MRRGNGGSVTTLLALASLAWLALAPGGADAQQSSKLEGLHRSLELGVFSTSVSNPLLREPGSGGGGSEVPVGQSRRTLGLRAGTLVASEQLALELSVALWRFELDDFTYTHPQISGLSARYSAIQVGYGFVDLGVHYAPWPKAPLSAFGFAGMGGKNSDYQVSGAAFPFQEWNGHQGGTEFVYDYGLGVRLFPERHISLVADFRWVPGDLITSSENCTGETATHWTGCRSNVSNRTHVLSLGAMLGIPFRSRARP